MERIELYYRLTPGWFVILAAKLGIGLLWVVGGLIALTRGNMTVAIWTVLVGGVAAVGAGLLDLRLLLDRKVKITLTPEGLLDHRMSAPVLLPWARVTSIYQYGKALHVEVSDLDLTRFTGPGTSKTPLSSSSVTVKLLYLDLSVTELKRLVHRVAPDVVFSNRTWQR